MSLAGPDSLVRNAPLPFAAGVSLAFGLLGFFSPCVLPLVPGYLSFLASSVGGADRRPRAVLGAALFVLGFSAVLVVEGTAFGAFAMAFRQDAPVIQRVLGAVTVVLGLAYLGWLRIPQVAIDARAVSRFGWLGAPLVGAAFGIAWGPCLTPKAGAVFALAYDQTAAGRGAVLMLCYGCGLGVPFVAAAWVVRGSRASAASCARTASAFVGSAAPRSSCWVWRSQPGCGRSGVIGCGRASGSAVRAATRRPTRRRRA